MNTRKPFRTLWGWLPVLLLLLAIPAVLLLGSTVMDRQVSQEALAMTEDAVRRAAVQCYALEGFYPSSLDYLERYYGVQVDESRCYVGYQYVAANLMPDITILPIS